MFVYKIENKITKKVYVGKTTRKINLRWNEHKAELRKNSHQNKYLQNSWNKYGEENFCFNILEKVSEATIDEKEVFWIEFFNSCSKKLGFNMTKTSNKKQIISDYQKSRLVARMIGNQYAKGMKHKKSVLETLRKNWLGKKHTENTKFKIKQKKMFYAKKVICITSGDVFLSIKDAARFANTSPANIRSVCRGKLKQIKGHSFRLENSVKT